MKGDDSILDLMPPRKKHNKGPNKSDKKLEKRMRPMQLPKAGVLSDEPVKENDNSDSCMDEPTTPEIHIPALHTDSHQLIHPNELDSKVMLISAEEVREEEWLVVLLMSNPPRRVAVLATAERVAHELGVHLSQEVGFQVRCDKKIGENSAISL
ncbi:hypothetical protein HID58_021976 [Brassica napus]|uniref:Uncharacterized protein n=1 Tax=Brassica napus TaxID=3708 RepID=A0ABQ8CXZ1_BRANA|nr:hypothetical protein HID58_021976 [Brassica napus]